ncbi:MAG: CDP-alcohol phosphatidyltransferase family protein [Candidatus Limnocylindrales bacterium]
MADPLARRMAAAGLTANHLTLIGFGIVIVGALLAAIEWWLLAGIIATAGSAFDMFDGAVARVTGTTSKLGAFLDSTFDRWGEAIVYLGIVIGCSRAGFDTGVWLATAAMGAAFMVSYARARAESLGFAPGKGMAAVGLAPREVRVVILGIGLVGTGLTGGVAPGATGQTILGGALLVIAVLATITVIQRILFTVKQAASEVDRP